MEDQLKTSLLLPVLGMRTPDVLVATRTAESASIYAVDDKEDLTELYTVLLQRAGYRVRVFNCRSEALAALKVERKKPDLLITDYRGHSMLADEFMRQCRAIHPMIQILMATGFHQTNVGFPEETPDRFIQKPFTAEEFMQEIEAALLRDVFSHAVKAVGL